MVISSAMPFDWRGRVTRGSAWLGGLAALLGAVGAAVMYLAANAWFGVRDLLDMILWSIPLGAFVGVATRALSRRFEAVPPLMHYLSFMLVGGLLGLLWTIIAGISLHAWINAFSFPVLFCWVTGGLVGGIAAVWAGRRRTWPAALVFTGAVLLALVRLNAYARAPEPRVRVVIKPGATPEEVQRVWDNVLGRPTGRPGEHDMLPGISSVAASGSVGDSQTLTVSFRKSLSRKDRDRILALIRRSALVTRVNPVSPTDSSGVRSSVSY
jgi:hypothetical protein